MCTNGVDTDYCDSVSLMGLKDYVLAVRNDSRLTEDRFDDRRVRTVINHVAILEISKGEYHASVGDRELNCMLLIEGCVYMKSCAHINSE